MPTCSVPYCLNASGKETRITFHEFPHETPLFLNKWLENIGRPNWRPGHRSVVCCEHFQKDDFDRQGRLRIGSFPSKFPKPPYRKKKKIDTDQSVEFVSIITAPVQDTASNFNKSLPLEKQVASPQNEPVVKESAPSLKEPLSFGKQAAKATAPNFAKPLPFEKQAAGAPNETVAKGIEPSQEEDPLSLADDSPSKNMPKIVKTGILRKSTRHSMKLVQKDLQVLVERIKEPPTSSQDLNVTKNRFMEPPLSSQDLIAMRKRIRDPSTSSQKLNVARKGMREPPTSSQDLPVMRKSIREPPTSSQDLNVIRKRIRESPTASQDSDVTSTKKTSEPTPCIPSQVATSISMVSCRICGETKEDNVDIFGTEGRHLCLVQLIQKCLPIEVSILEALPHCLCKRCIFRLRSCFELITTCEKTNRSLKGREAKLKETKDADPPIIYSKPVQPPNAGGQNRRFLFLEMSLKEGIPVKTMMTQAIQELTLRLKPKEKRESKPQGRIMFLDLQGGTEVHPEQMKNAISMLFPSSEGEKKATENKPHPVGTATTPPPAPGSYKPGGSNKPTGSQAAVSVMKQAVQTKVTDSTLSSTDSPKRKKPSQPKILVSDVSSSSSPTTSTQPTLVLTGSPSGTNLNRVVPIPPLIPAVPLSILPITSGQPSALRIASMAGSLPPGRVPQIIRLHTKNLSNVNANSSAVEKVTKSVQGTAALDNKDDDDDDDDDESDDDENDDNIYEEDYAATYDMYCNSGDTDIPPLVPIEPSQVAKENPKEVVGNALPVIDIAKMKNAVITKINNIGKQVKLGDKIVGIVLRNSDDKNDVQRKLQAAFTSEEALTKDRIILPKGSMTIPLTGEVNALSIEVVGEKKLKDHLIDVPSAVDLPSTTFDRRNSRKLCMSFMWRRTGFLVSSYQKLFTWQLATDESGNVEPIITCRVCTFTANNKMSVETHLSAHPELQCPVCWKYFLTDGKVFEHMNVIHSISAPAECTSKKKTLITWRHHTLRRTPIKPYQCSRCDKRFKSKDCLQRHANMCKEQAGSEKVVAVNDLNLLSCPSCTRLFTSAKTLKEHSVIHVKRTSWLCDVCGQVLKSASNYRTHIAKHDENAHEYQFQCNICKKRFKVEKRYEEHLKNHEIRQTFICSSCGKSFNTRNGLRQHEILHGERTLQCRFCPNRFHRRDHLRIHESSHTKSKSGRTDVKSLTSTGRMFTCRFCTGTTVRFPHLRELINHYVEVHPLERTSIGAKRFECDRCSKTFINSTLWRHHQMWHAGLRPYNCSDCGAGFMIKERLRNHELTHTNERPFKCQHCGKGFRSRNVLKQHKAIHNDPSEFYKCEFCAKSFSRIDNLRTHTRVHTGEKPWKCLHCHRQFRLRSEATKHVQIAHQITPEEATNNIETIFDPNNPGSSISESESAESAIAAIAGITTVQDMELLIEDDDEIEECEVPLE